MKVLFVRPKMNIYPLDKAMLFPPEELLLLASISPSSRIIDLNVQKEQDYHRMVADFDLVATTAYTPNINNALEILRYAKSKGKATLIGGVHATLNYKDLMQNGFIDYIIRGEGEVAFKQLISGKNPKEIAGLSYRKGGKAVHNMEARLIRNLDQLPFIDFSKVDMSRYHTWGRRLVGINTSRGCPRSCTFCCTPILWRHKWRAKSAKRVIEEIKRVPKGTKVIFLTDDNLCHDMERVEQICDFIIQENLDGYQYGFEARADDLLKKPNVLAKMSKANFKLCVLGIESASEESLKQYGKGEGRESIHNAIDLLDRNGIFIWGTFMLGSANETKQDMIDTINLAASLPIDLAQFTFCTPFPGTRFFDRLKDQKLLVHDNFSRYNSLSPIMLNCSCTKKELARIMFYAYWRFYNPRMMIQRAARYYQSNKRWILDEYLWLSPKLITWSSRFSFFFTYKIIKNQFKTES